MNSNTEREREEAEELELDLPAVIGHHAMARAVFSWGDLED